MSDKTETLSANQYVVTHSVGPNQAGIRLDRFLMDRYTRRSREQLKRAIDSGGVSVERPKSPHLNLGRIKASFALQPGDIVKVLSTRKPEPEVNFNYEKLFEDDEILVIHKPPHLPVHPAGRYFFNTLLVHLKTDGFATDLKANREYFLVHRIDKETSGILLLAKTKESCNQLTAQFRNRETGKYYLAICHGAPNENFFTINSPMGKKPGAPVGLKMYSIPESEGGLSAHTDFEVIESRVGTILGEQKVFSLLACFPKTGRQHQIRVHADAAGHPLVGDKIYGMPDDDVLALLDANRDLREELDSEVSPDPLESESAIQKGAPETPDEERFEIPGPTLSLHSSPRIEQLKRNLILPRHALHAAGLKFKHPKTGKEMIFEAPLPSDLSEFFQHLTGTPIAQFKTKRWE